MTRRRRTFEIDAPAEAVAETGAEAPRRGPMAAAVRENAEALRARRALEDQVRAENDALAHEHVRLKRAGLILDRIPTHRIDTAKLVRDRAPGPDEALAELKASILAIGLSNPIRVEQKPDGRFELIQGWRRLRAFLELEAEHQDGRFTHIPAGYVAAGDALAVSYRRMIDENLVRKDVSFAEMARLAQACAADPATGCGDLDAAVATLFRSAGYQKRSYIRAFAELLDMIGGALAHPQALGRNLGLAVRRRLGGDPAAAAQLAARLAAAPGRTAEEEAGILRAFAEPPAAAQAAPVAPQTAPKPAPARRSPATGAFRVRAAIGSVRCVASDGRLDLRAPVDFAAVDPHRLERALAAFIDALEIDGA